MTSQIRNISKQSTKFILYVMSISEQRYEGIQSPTKLVIKSRSHDSGYAENHQPNHLSNGWVHHSPSSAELSNSCSSSNEQSHDMIKSPWIYPKNCSFKGIPSNSSARSSFALHSGSEEGSLNTPQSPTGSKDSLLSDESSTHLPHLAYQQQRINRSHPSFSSNESFSRLSRSSIRSTSTGSSQFYHNRSSDDGQRQMYPSSEWNSSSSLADIDKLAHQLAESSLCCTSTPKFIKDTTSYWYKPDITREQAMAMLRTKPEGSFVVRDSRCYPGGFGLAVKVHQVSQSVLTTSKPRSDTELVRHFLIEPNSKGVKLKGCVNEPVFGSLSSLICQHSITPMALPCKLIIPTENQEIPSPAGEDRNCVEVSNSTAELLRLGAACNVLYLGSADTESLTGPEAIERAMRECKQNQSDPKKTSVVHFKVSPQGITLTDQARRIFFRRHYPTLTITYCGMDPSASKPKNRRWDASSHHGPPDARVFGFVAKKYGGSIDNKCHLFAELDLDQPAPAIVNFVSKVLIASK